MQDDETNEGGSGKDDPIDDARANLPGEAEQPVADDVPGGPVAWEDVAEPIVDAASPATELEPPTDSSISGTPAESLSDDLPPAEPPAIASAVDAPSAGPLPISAAVRPAVMPPVASDLGAPRENFTSIESPAAASFESGDRQSTRQRNIDEIAGHFTGSPPAKNPRLNPTSDGGPPLARPIVLVTLATEQVEAIIHKALDAASERDQKTLVKIAEEKVNYAFWSYKVELSAITRKYF